MWIYAVIILTVLAVFLLLYSIINCNGRIAGGMWILCPFLLFAAFCIYKSNTYVHSINTIESRPTALDVYRGNTELRITSVNGVPTDTVVVFKNK
jgi:hypothetical protein